MSVEPVGLDKLTAAQMARWLRETAVNTRRYSNPTWCDAYKKPYDPLAAHVAFRMEQAADQIERLDADAACEKAEKESLRLEVERLRADVEHREKYAQQMNDILQENERLRASLDHIATYPKMRQATRISSIMRYARAALDVGEKHGA